jgi:hypothetical protein
MPTNIPTNGMIGNRLFIQPSLLAATGRSDSTWPPGVRRISQKEIDCIDRNGNLYRDGKSIEVKRFH